MTPRRCRPRRRLLLPAGLLPLLSAELVGVGVRPRGSNRPSSQACTASRVPCPAPVAPLASGSMASASSAAGAYRAWFFRHFFHLLLISSSVAMWVVPAWLLATLTDVRIPISVHVVAATTLYLVNRKLVRGPRRVAGNWLRRYSAFAFTLLICSLFLAVVWPLSELAQALATLGDPAASRLVASAFRWVGLSGIAVVSSALAFGYTGGQRQLGVVRVRVPLPNWSGKLRILQLSDIHIGQNLTLEQLAAFVARANREAPDLVCLTGDIADGPHADLDRFFPILAQLRARHGIIAILGNHDHYAGAEHVQSALEQHGIRVLRDDAVTLEVEGEKLHVLGLDDRGLDWARGMRHDHVLSELLRRAPKGVARLLLVHRPDIFRQAAKEGVDLTLSGHTHGGQLAVPWFGGRRRNLAEFVTPFDRGLFRREGSRLYVNCGLGVTAQRIRLFTPREITVFELCPARSRQRGSTAPEESFLAREPKVA